MDWDEADKRPADGQGWYRTASLYRHGSRSTLSKSHMVREEIATVRPMPRLLRVSVMPATSSWPGQEI